MRILFTFIGGLGHFRPLIPIARAAQAAGHTVAVAGTGKRTQEITAAGFTAFPTSGPPQPTSPSERAPMEAPDPEADLRQLAEGFAGRGARRHAAAITEIARSWRPDVVVRDEVDFGSAIAAELLGLPCATVIVLAAGGFLRPEVVAASLREVRSEVGLPPDPEMTMLSRGPILAPFPQSFRDPQFPLPPDTFSYRSAVVPAPGPPREKPTVYVTFGTVNTAIEPFGPVLGGLATLPVDVVATVGNSIEPAELGPVRDGVRIEQFIPQDEVLPHCDLVISHAGSGSVIGGLTHGLPSVLLPMGADQPYNARRCADLGVAQVLDPMTATADEVRAAASTVLADARYREAAAEIRDEISALPLPDETIPLLEALV
ncbi:glycosyltransferase [Luteipulveratus mongoliensis]|uniref:Glycosyl transferase n=1 Tax=Luteipulveratus mongoliensis TaxID=571913 RepID=A0A0K1JGW2_9MICO|nr:glycosyltransferase [Luteipulveratus mongoliensis]AKU15825.1 glycosyl transferase [Luteipulveratus mongoliensis]